jgi:hypothetical protein
MATVYIELNPDEAEPYSTNFPQRVHINGTNFPVAGLAFDATTDEACCFKFIPRSFSSALTLELCWYADTASSGNVVWESQISAITPNTDSQDVETDALATLNYVQDTHLQTTNQRMHRCSISITNTDSMASNDLVHLRVARDANSTSATDDMAGDAILTWATITYDDGA